MTAMIFSFFLNYSEIFSSSNPLDFYSVFQIYKNIVITEEYVTPQTGKEVEIFATTFSSFESDHKESECLLFSSISRLSSRAPFSFIYPLNFSYLYISVVLYVYTFHINTSYLETLLQVLASQSSPCFLSVVQPHDVFNFH